jgi:hypothetical protein
MSAKGNFENICLFDVYLVVFIMEIKFVKVLSTTQFIQNVINDRNGEFFFDCDFFEGAKIKTHVSGSLFLEYHDYWRRIRVCTGTDNTHCE